MEPAPTASSDNILPLKNKATGDITVIAPELQTQSTGGSGGGGGDLMRTIGALEANVETLKRGVESITPRLQKLSIDVGKKIGTGGLWTAAGVVIVALLAVFTLGYQALKSDISESEFRVTTAINRIDDRATNSATQLAQQINVNENALIDVRNVLNNIDQKLSNGEQQRSDGKTHP